MDLNVKGSVVKVKRGSFVNPSSGELVAFCHFYVLSQGPTTDNEMGFNYEKFGCKVDFYPKLIELIKANKPVVVSCEMVKQKDESYKRRALAIDDLKLI